MTEKTAAFASHSNLNHLLPFLLATRIVLVGPPGSKRKEIALGLTAHFSEEGKDFQCISVGDLITRQITQKNQQYGENIE